MLLYNDNRMKFQRKQQNNKIIDKFVRKIYVLGFPGSSVVKNLPANAGDMGSIPGPGRSHMTQSN